MDQTKNLWFLGMAKGREGREGRGSGYLSLGGSCAWPSGSWAAASRLGFCNQFRNRDILDPKQSTADLLQDSFGESYSESAVESAIAYGMQSDFRERLKLLMEKFNSPDVDRVANMMAKAGAKAKAGKAGKASIECSFFLLSWCCYSRMLFLFRCSTSTTTSWTASIRSWSARSETSLHRAPFSSSWKA